MKLSDIATVLTIIVAIIAIATFLAGLWPPMPTQSVTLTPTPSATPTPTPSARPKMPVINPFVVSPSVISSGEGSTLSWSVSGATSVSIDHGIGGVASTGTREVSPTETTTYTLTATNEMGSVDATVEVIVEVAPSPTPSTLSLPFMIDESGWVTQYGRVGTGAEHSPQAGDFKNNEVVRGFLSFDLTGMPRNAKVQSARLILPDLVISGEPFPSFGSLKFEAVHYGLSLASEAYDTPGYLVLQDTYGQPGPVIGVTAGVEEAISQGYSRFQIRFSFSLGTDSDQSADEYIINLYGEAPRPILEVILS